jgi:hypothetical protein
LDQEKTLLDHGLFIRITKYNILYINILSLEDGPNPTFHGHLDQEKSRNFTLPDGYLLFEKCKIETKLKRKIPWQKNGFHEL